MPRLAGCTNYEFYNNGLSTAEWELSSVAVERQCCLLNSKHSS